MKEKNKHWIVMVLFLISGLALNFSFELSMMLEWAIIGMIIVSVMFGWYAKSAKVEQDKENK
ncbi:hypothetical protein LCGC14_1241570 [marine sediment metagenome]|uniref:Uncharacterized protein n=1 Tax=marine sediment metagenome TaxID=412755 RepID=A0A0F9L5Q5_9ZZZZ